MNYAIHHNLATKRIDIGPITKVQGKLYLSKEKENHTAQAISAVAQHVLLKHKGEMVHVTKDKSYTITVTRN